MAALLRQYGTYLEAAENNGVTGRGEESFGRANGGRQCHRRAEDQYSGVRGATAILGRYSARRGYMSRWKPRRWRGEKSSVGVMGEFCCRQSISTSGRRRPSVFVVAGERRRRSAGVVGRR